jgi:hypothetical protein
MDVHVSCHIALECKSESDCYTLEVLQWTFAFHVRLRGLLTTSPTAGPITDRSRIDHPVLIPLLISSIVVLFDSPLIQPYDKVSCRVDSCQVWLRLQQLLQLRLLS